MQVLITTMRSLEANQIPKFIQSVRRLFIRLFTYPLTYISLRDILKGDIKKIIKIYI